MKAIFKKRWVIVVSIFLIINIVGLFQIISVLSYGRGIPYLIKKSIARILSPVKKHVTPYGRRVEKEFILLSIDPHMDADTPSISMRFSDDVDLEKAKGYIVITPDIPFHLEGWYSGMQLYADFKPGATYSIEVLKGMPSMRGTILTTSKKEQITAPDYAPDVKFKVPGMYMSLKSSMAIPVEVMNMDKLDVEIHKVYENNIVYFLSNSNPYSIPSDLGIDVYEEEIATSIETNIAKDVFINLNDILGEGSKGLFFLSVRQPDSYYSDVATKLVLTTDIGIIAKKSNSGLLVWLNSLFTTNPVPFTRVSVYTKTNQKILEGTTNEEGIIHFKDVSWQGDKTPYVIIASNDYDLSFIELSKCDISETAFDISGRPYLSSGYEAFAYTDKGVYRPGERTHLKAIIRGIGFEAPSSFPVNIEVKRPDEQEYTKSTAMLSKFGTIETDIDIDEAALTGIYAVNLLLPGDDKPIGTARFNVEEFMPDRLKVTIDTLDKRFAIKDDISVVIKAEQFFGAPAENRDVELTCDLKIAEFKPKGFDDYVFTDQEKTFTTQTLRFGERKTDQDGKADFVIKLPEQLLPPSAIDCSIQATVKELGGRAVTAYAKRTIDPYPYYIGIRKATEGYATAGEPIEFDYVIISPEGVEMKVPELNIQVSRIKYNSVLKKDDNGTYRYSSEKYEDLILEDTVVSPGSSGTYKYAPTSYGDYILRISSSAKDSHSAGIKFYCSGYGYTPWAMEKPDRIDLSLDKNTYNEGDTAKLLIKSPFTGEALVTISKATILSTKRITLTSMTQEIPIEINSDFSPNAYCSVTVIKPLEASQEWVAHRAYGIIPIMIDNASDKLAVSISADAKAEPNDIFPISIEIKDFKNTGQEAELSIALVDEGVLQLTNFKTPDPYDFFYGKRANPIISYDLYSLLLPEYEQAKIGSDSSPSSDASKKLAFDPKKYLNPISAKRVKPIALWKGTVITDAQGKAKVEFKIPEFTGSLRIMVVAATDQEFGNAQSDIKVTEPLMIEPTLPRFLSTGDKCSLSISVFNNTGQQGDVSVSVKEASEPDAVSTKTKNIKDKKEATLEFPFTAPKEPKKIEIDISAALSGKYTVSRAIELPVRPPVPFSTISGSGSIKAPNDSVITIPGNWLNGTQSYSLVIMSLPGLEFAGGLKYLVQYPYGCIEQTTSCTYPLLYLKDIAKNVDSDKYSPQTLDSYVNVGINKVLSMQTYSGGFAMWPGYQNPYKWGSIYATDFLVEADNAGYVVNKRSKKSALRYLEKLLSDGDTSLDLKAYSCFVLAKADRIKHSWIRRLQEKQSDLSAASKFYLASCLSLIGDTKAVSEMLGQGLPDKQTKRETGGELNSYTKENAIALSTYMDIDPENTMVPVLVKRLEGAMVNGNWQTTQDNAQALLGLGKYARYLEETEDSDCTGNVVVGNEMVAQFDNEHKANLRGLDLGNKQITVSVKGKGTIYYYWSAEGVPSSGVAVDEDKGIKVRRTYYTREGTLADINNINHGDVIVVDISIDAEATYQNVVVADLLPACFEIENPRLTSSEKINWISKDSFEPDHIDIRDDRLLLFTDLPETKDLHYRYIVRAVTKGDFTLPAISASCMYDPSIVSVNGQGKVKVK